MEQTDPAGTPAPEPSAGERYLLLADISGYTGFMTSVEHEHGVDFSNGIPAAYGVLAGCSTGHPRRRTRLRARQAGGRRGLRGRPGDPPRRPRRRGPRDDRRDVPGVHQPAHEGHPGQRPRVHRLPGRGPPRPQGDPPSRCLGSPGRRCRERPARPGGHRRPPPAQEHDPGPDRLQPYLFITDAAAGGLGLADVGQAHREDYPDASPVPGRIVELAATIPEGVGH